MEPKLYISDPNFKMSPSRLSETAYAEVLESLIIVCADVLFYSVSEKKVYLANRIVEPLKGYWMVGGRMNAGETGKEGIVRLVKRETSLELPPEQFTFVDMHRYIHPLRKQIPQEKGSDTLAYTFTAPLTDEEVQSIKLVSTEYGPQGVRALTRTDLTTLQIHPAICALYDAIFPA